MRVGLMGGSFNPAHAGHLHVAETARVRLGLDRVVWLVSPGNPLKSAAPPLGLRIASARGVARGPSMVVSDAEARLGSRFTIDTVRLLKARHPGVRFVWLMGGDNLASFHRWKGWTDILREVPVAVVGSARYAHDQPFCAGGQSLRRGAAALAGGATTSDGQSAGVGLPARAA
jgi:nicotinate-nucleotide adenylyltransferase